MSPLGHDPSSTSPDPVSVDDYQTLLKAVALAYWQTDATGNVLSDTTWQSSLQSPLQLGPGQHWIDLVHPLDRTRALALWQLAGTERKPLDAQLRVSRSSAEPDWMLLRLVPVLVPDGSISKWMGLASFTDGSHSQQAHHAYLLALSDQLRPLLDPMSIQATAAEHLGQTLRVNRVHYGEVTPDGRSVVVSSNYVDGVPQLTGSFVMANFGPVVLDRLKAGQTIIVDDLAAEPGLSAQELAANVQVGVAAQVGVPLLKAGELTGILSVHSAQPRHWTPREVGLIEETAERTWEAVERARTGTVLRQREEKYRQLAQLLEERVLSRTQDLLQANQDLQRSNDNLLQFAYVASHDLQEPLRKIQSFSSLIEQELTGQLTDLGNNYLQRISHAASRMSTLIKDLLAYSRIATRQQAFGPVSLEAIVAQSLINLELMIQQRGVQLERMELPVIKGDETQLGQLFENLLSNAIKFTPADQYPRIRIGLRRQGRSELPILVSLTSEASQFYAISVQDEGIGFDEKYVDRIFQVFQRLHGKGEYAGTGIGLAICEKVVTNHGGIITARSKPGAGATFTVYLPV